MNTTDLPVSPRWRAGRALCIVSAITYGLLTAAIDALDPHHLRNPSWPGHARFHLLWLICAGALGALASLYLFWTATPGNVARIRTGALLGAVHIGGFFLAAIFKRATGAEFDADGRVLLGFLPPALLHLTLSASLLAAGVTLCSKRAVDR